MRIIAGAFKGRRLAAPTWDGLRPTSDKLRETLFNVLATRVRGARVLDLFAGTGAVGLEALSRGAQAVMAVEADRRAVALATRNAESCGVGADYTIRTGDVLIVVAGLDAAAAFDIIFLDPPYAFPRTADVLTACAARVRSGGLVVLERATRLEPVVPAGLTRTRDIRSGDSSLTFFTPTEAA